MIYSDDAVGANDFLRIDAQNAFYQYHLVGSRHTDLTDLPLIWPILGVYGQLGTLPPHVVAKTLNQLVQSFWDSTLKGGSNASLIDPDLDHLETIVQTR